MMAYQLANSLPGVFAAIAVAEGSVHPGFYEDHPTTPNHTISVMDLHADQDQTIPANQTLSNDFFRYNTVHQNTQHWAKYNGCNGTGGHYKTDYDGTLGFWCKKVAATCKNSEEVVWCAYEGPHGWPDDGNFVGAKMVWSFFKKHSKK